MSKTSEYTPGFGTAPIRRLEANTRGRDWVAGDIHGYFPELAERLSAVGFEPATDRLICVGDLVDRGPCSHEVLQWLEQPWFHSVRGNHEDMLLEAAQSTDPRARPLWFANGGAWWDRLEMLQRLDIADALETLPIAVEVPTEQGLAVIVHAEVPAEFDTWLDCRQALEAAGSNSPLAERLTRGRERYYNALETRLPDVSAVVCGHSRVEEPRRLGNHWIIDTAIDQGGRLSVLSLDALCAEAATATGR
ncbi:metallophosphoesterase [Alkalilimnicola sp. S0819]|uniref:metallophosphoesterase n=1 Tax=Alkalilimnicola sp. S0819 TaxID=2613922 RepID=UPI0012620885|nr:metallophosphoesterase [Alkalilimnicola sp. S0819]KAB7627847.1 serine/threonine protein phosphatase [Alkalilimnicola sp. S0819]MPQ15481.1 serine/threonine protein phosphatase [Alkalilimnicola sp. S0819]